MQRLDGDHPPDHRLHPLGPFDAADQRGDLGIEVGEFRPGAAGRQGRRARRHQPLQQVGPPRLQRRQRRHVGVGRIEAVDSLLEVRDHTGDVRAVEAAGELVEPAATAFGLQGPQFVQLVQAEGHHAGEGRFVDRPHDVLQVVAVPRAGIVAPAVVGRGKFTDFDQVALVAAQAHAIVVVGFLREAGQVRPLVSTLDRKQRPLGRHANREPPRARQAGIEHTAAEGALETEEDRPHELEDRGLTRLVGAVQHLHAGAQAVDHDSVEGAEPFDVDAFDEHAALLPRRMWLGRGPAAATCCSG